MRASVNNDNRRGSPEALQAVRWLILAYVVFLLFEGALRKWITPGLSSPLLIIRDPIVILIYVFSIMGHVFPDGRLIKALGLLAAMAAFTGLLATAFHPAVYLYGIRTNFLHFPLIFVIPRVMTYSDVVNVGRWILILGLPMTYLIAKQFSADPNDVLNAAAGGALGHQIATSGGKVRASGTFSFVTGVIAFYGIVAGFLLNALVRPKTYPKWLQVAGTAALFVGVVTSGSRSVVAIVGGGCAAVAVAAILKPQMLGRAIVTFSILGIVALAVAQLTVVQEGLDVTNARFADAGGHEGFWVRLITPFFPLLSAPLEAPFFGYGLGAGTNAGAGMGGGGALVLGEDDWSRVIFESGPVVGLLFVGWRASVTIHMLMSSMRALSAGNLLPLLLLTASGSFILYGQIGQPTIQGFAALGGGLCLAAVNMDPDAKQEVRENSVAPDVTASLPKTYRGRSAYAEALHRRVSRDCDA